VVRPPVVAGELSLSCARLMAGRVTTLWVRRPLSVNQRGQLSLPSLRGRLNECNPLIMGYGGGDFTAAAVAALAGGRATAQSLCVQAVGGDESALEVCIHVMRYTNRRLYFFFTFLSDSLENSLISSTFRT